MKLELTALTRPSQYNEYVQHLFAKESYDQASIIVEIVYAVNAKIVMMKELWTKKVDALQGEIYAGPPPPSKEERDLKKAIAELEQDIGVEP